MSKTTGISIWIIVCVFIGILFAVLDGIATVENAIRVALLVCAIMVVSLVTIAVVRRLRRR